MKTGSLAPVAARRGAFLALAMLTPVALSAQAQIMIVGNDEKIVFDEAGKQIQRPPGKDTVAIYDLMGSTAAPKLLGTLQLENSVVGPPTNMAVAPSGEIALVANSVDQIKDGDNWKPVPDNKIYVIDLTAKPPRLLTTLEGGKQPSGMAINRKGDLALVANRADNSLSVLSIAGKDVKLVANVAMGDSVTGVAITPDGKHALAVKSTTNRIAWLDIEGQTVTYNKYDMIVGNFPYNVDVTPNGKIAIVVDNGANGGSDGNIDTAAIIDLEASPPRVIDFLTVDDAPEGLAISPKGNLAVAVSVRGSNSDHKAFFYHKNGTVAALKIDGKKVTKISEIEVGGTPEAVGFSPDGKYLYVGNYSDGDMSVFKVDGTKLVDVGKRMKMEGHPAALRVSPPK